MPQDARGIAGNVTTVSLARRDYSRSDTDEDEDSTENEIEEYFESRTPDSQIVSSNHPATTANVSNSKHVEIKPTTQTVYRAPVTNIYNQYLHPTNPVHRLSVVSENNGQSDELAEESEPRVVSETSKKRLCHRKRSTIGIASAFGVVVVIILVVVVSTVEKRAVIDPQVVDPEVTDKPNDDLVNETHIYSRELWNGRPIPPNFEEIDLVHPTELVFAIIDFTKDSPCTTFEVCSKSLQTMKGKYFNSYNFLVGEDGNIYETLGWDVRNVVRKNAIQIGFIGRHRTKNVTDGQIKGLKKLLKLGVELKKLDENYKLIGQNKAHAWHFEPTQHLIAAIRLLPHFAEDSYAYLYARK